MGTNFSQQHPVVSKLHKAGFKLKICFGFDPNYVVDVIKLFDNEFICYFLVIWNLEKIRICKNLTNGSQYGPVVNVINLFGANPEAETKN